MCKVIISKSQDHNNNLTDTLKNIHSKATLSHDLKRISKSLSGNMSESFNSSLELIAGIESLSGSQLAELVTRL